MHAIYVLHGQPDGAPLRGVTRNGTKIATQTAFVPFDEVRMHGAMARLTRASLELACYGYV